MAKTPRSMFGLFIGVLVLAALACGPLSLGSEQAAETSTEIAADPDALVAAAVATVEARESAVADRPVTVAGDVIDLDLQNSLIDLYERVNPSVVFILTDQGSGSGFVFDSQGHIVTNNHVVADGTDFEVVFSSGDRSEAELIGTDVDSDLAVIQVTDLPPGAVPVALGDSNNVQVGQFVIAIGNPFEQQSSMSFGIVSGLGRSLMSQRVLPGSGFYSLPEVIQTDAPINPGNSGGPLLNLAGEVVGVNSAIRSATGVNSGVGFSIPVNAVKLIAPNLIADGSYVYPYMGVSISDINLAQQERLGLPSTQGALVTQVPEGQPAEAAGVRSGDVITSINGAAIGSSDGLISYLVFNTEVGQTVDVQIIRDGEEVIIPVTLAERP